MGTESEVSVFMASGTFRVQRSGQSLHPDIIHHRVGQAVSLTFVAPTLNQAQLKRFREE